MCICCVCWGGGRLLGSDWPLNVLLLKKMMAIFINYQNLSVSEFSQHIVEHTRFAGY